MSDNTVPDSVRSAVINSTLGASRIPYRGTVVDSKPSVGCPLCGGAANVNESSSRYTRCSSCGSNIRCDFWRGAVESSVPARNMQSLGGLLQEALEHRDKVMSGSGDVDMGVIDEMRKRLNS